MLKICCIFYFQIQSRKLQQNKIMLSRSIFHVKKYFSDNSDGSDVYRDLESVVLEDEVS